MTRKDFELIAATLAYCQDHAEQGAEDDTEPRCVSWVSELMADALAQTNPLFDRARFLRACKAR